MDIATDVHTRAFAADESVNARRRSRDARRCFDHAEEGNALSFCSFRRSSRPPVASENFSRRRRNFVAFFFHLGFVRRSRAHTHLFAPQTLGDPAMSVASISAFLSATMPCGKPLACRRAAPTPSKTERFRRYGQMTENGPMMDYLAQANGAERPTTCT
jgi:hypothetical protein